MPDTQQKHVTVAGATGKLGSQIASALLSISSSVQVHVICRDKSRLAPELSSDSRVTVFETDGYDAAKVREAIRGCSAVVCAYLGPDDFMIDAQKVLIDACEAEGVPRFIPSDYTLDYRPLKVGDLPNKDPMIQIVQYMETKSKVKAVHVFIGCFTETFFFWLGVWEPEKGDNGTLNYWGTGDEKWDFTSYGTAAKYVAHVLLDDDVVGYVKFRDTVSSINEIAKSIASHRGGRQPQLNPLGTLGHLKIKTDGVREKGNVGWPDMAMFYTYWIENGVTSLGPDSELLNSHYNDVETISMDDFIAKNIAKA